MTTIFLKPWHYCFFFLVFLSGLLLRMFVVNSEVEINQTEGVYQLKGPVSIPKVPSYHCPYFKRISPHSQMPFRRNCSVCSVVSNSGHLLNSGAGPEIDSTDCIFRMNDAKTETKYHGDVGSRLSIRVVSKRGLMDYYETLKRRKDVEPETLLVWDSALRPPRIDSVSAIALEVAKKFETLEIYLLNNHQPGMPSFDEIFDREVGSSSFVTGSSASCGFHTIVIASHVCDKIIVYGIVPSNYCSILRSNDPSIDKTKYVEVPYYYYPNAASKMNECDFFENRWQRSVQGHRFATEHSMFERWSKLRPIEFRAPSWS